MGKIDRKKGLLPSRHLHSPLSPSPREGLSNTQANKAGTYPGIPVYEETRSIATPPGWDASPS